MIQELDSSDFEQTIKKSKKPIIVDFFLESCGPCMELTPIFEELSEEFKDKLEFARVNLNENQDIAMQKNISSAPTIIIFNHGFELERIMGLMPKENLKEVIEEVLTRIVG